MTENVITGNFSSDHKLYLQCKYNVNYDFSTISISVGK